MTYFGPINIFFYRQSDGALVRGFNGGLIPKVETLREARDLMDELIAEGQESIDRENKRREREMMDEDRVPKSPRKKPEPISGFIYVLKSLQYTKIGRCKSWSRINVYRTENPHGIELLVQVRVADYVKTEKELLERYKTKKIQGEWFRLTDADVEEIRKDLNQEAL